MDEVVSVRNARGAFTLVELAVVILLVAVLAGLGVPRLIKSVERSKAAEAFRYLDAVRSAQERYAAREGAYATNLAAIGVEAEAPAAFTVPGTIASDGPRGSWSLTLTRAGGSRSYGAYTVTFTQDGYDPAHSTIDGMAEILPPRRGASGSEAAVGS